jgi:biotin operon repressor
MSATAIADELGCSATAVNHMLHQHKIPLRGRAESKAISSHYKTRACDRCGKQFLPRSSGARYCSVECRTSGPPAERLQQRWTVYPQLQDREWLRARYEEPRSGASIADELGCDTQLVADNAVTRSTSGPGHLQIRQGKHGAGVRYVCNSCGSHDVVPIELT